MTRRKILKTAGTVLLGTNADENWQKTWRIFEATTAKEIRWRDFPLAQGGSEKLAAASAFFVGEQHDDPETHRVELALLQGLFSKVGSRLTLAMEMFERDNQTALTDYVTGKTDEATFQKAVRFWPNYPTDYRPLIEFARQNKIPVLASNAPLAIVRRVGREGLAILNTLTEEEKATIAAYVNAPDGDEYARRFASVMAGPGHGENKMDAAKVRRFYEAQCLRDDTMAETVALALNAGRTVLHINGSFHSDAGLGTVARLLWRRPLNTRLTLVKVVPYKADVTPEPLRGEANYLIFVPDKRLVQDRPAAQGVPATEPTKQ